MVNAISIAGDLVASSSFDHKVKLWSMRTKKEVAAMEHDDWVWCVVLHNDTVISASDDKTVRVWETRTGKLMHTWYHLDICNNLDISPDKKILAVAYGSDQRNGGVSLFDISSYKKLGEVKLDNPKDVRFLNDQTIIAGNYDGEINMITMN